ncbi:hypothetical protein SAMN02745247_00203 [Butyrivibrio hungatei DSM 14810]|uniref:Uncharacterized protein n=2 Tax=Butyrivibrio hungatei TaxID=185008 RepID=A0A1M7RRV2_9FIRM|nr:hypothetical protein SAMN02745247_00203 [Butyrivibrio hungatei DSM 14810]
MELIIAIFFFSLASAVCVRLFFSAHILAEKTVNLNSAVTWSQNMSEAFYGQNGDIKKIAELYPTAFVSNNTLMLFFDKNWEIVSDDVTQASYEVLLTTQKNSARLVYADVSEYKGKISGNAMTGHIAVIDIRNTEEVISEIPDDPDIIIIDNKVDVYLRKEAANE